MSCVQAVAAGSGCAHRAPELVVVAAAAIAVAAVSVGGTDQNSERLPVDRPQTVEPVPEYIAHAMPAILKDAALTPLDKLPNWTTFRIDAYASPKRGQAPSRAALGRGQ